MTTHTLGTPAELKRWLEDNLPRQHGTYKTFVRVTARDASERRCPVWDCDHYEVQAFYTTPDLPSLAALEAAFQASVPGVYLTTQVRAGGAGDAIFTNSCWPPQLGTGRRDRGSLRIQVIALMRDPAVTSSTSREG